MTALRPKAGASAVENWLAGGDLVPGDQAREAPAPKPAAKAAASAQTERAMEAQDEVLAGMADALGDEGLREWARRMAADPKTLPKLAPIVNKIMSLPQNTSASKEFHLYVTEGAPVDFDPVALRASVDEAKRRLVEGTLFKEDE